MKRLEKQPDYGLLKTATRRQIAASGGVESAATVSRVGAGAISQYQNPDKPDWFIPLDVAADLQRDSGQAHVIHALARMAGGYFVKPSAQDAVGAFSGVLPEIGRDFGELLKDSAFALSTGTISDQYRNKLLTDIETAISVLCLARGALEGGV